MKILADLHHEDLYESLRILFEDRLGHSLYRPIGLEWFKEGFWEVYRHPATAEQYLGLHVGKAFEEALASDPTDTNFTWLNKGLIEKESGVYYVPARTTGVINRAITLEAFKQTKFDIIISSMPVHFNKFEALKNAYQPQAKHIFQMGNMWAIPPGVQNFLNSTTVTPHVPMNHVRYHQEFSLDRFHPEEPVNPRKVINMMHLMHDPGTFMKFESLLPEFDFKAHGVGNRDGCVPEGSIAPTIRGTGFVWHMKSGGEGYGYNIHNAYASGKPMIVRGSFFAGMTAEYLFQDGVNCIDVGKHTDAESVAMIRNAADNYPIWSAAAYNRFKEVVNFDQEAEAIKQFLAHLI